MAHIMTITRRKTPQTFKHALHWGQHNYRQKLRLQMKNNAATK